MNLLGARIRDLRKQAGMTQEEVGRVLSVGKSTISQYENGITTPDLDSVRKLADLFRVPTDYLLGRTNDLPATMEVQREPSAVSDAYLKNNPWLRRLRPDLQRAMIPVIDAGLLGRIAAHGAPDGGFAALTDAQLTALCEGLVDHHKREEALRKQLDSLGLKPPSDHS